MKKILPVYLLLTVIWGQEICSQVLSKNKDYNGILLLYSGRHSVEITYEIFNLDKTLFGEIKSINGNEPSCPKLKGKILAYYDDYYIFHFLAKYNKTDSSYYVRVGNSVRMIPKDASMEFLSWPEYILKFYCEASKENPLRSSSSDTSEVIKIDYERTGFKCLEINGDWVKVECDQECEGCPQGKKIKGWIRWKKDDNIILKQYFVC
jgi:hypothetical protein